MCVNYQCVNVADVDAPDCGDCSMNGVSCLQNNIYFFLYFCIILHATVWFRKSTRFLLFTLLRIPFPAS